ncbi:hypothetical protein E3P99_02778 [Wallemia hederae]|uniref:Nudix hydrolase domain-containing protein n=1 Tax=Wallemia hederae TaxID=1540922 RepID=A0A4T0FL38_9BASI|nr:hypothetical protein E3P99_02778 [Wallemia hederae]
MTSLLLDDVAGLSSDSKACLRRLASEDDSVSANALMKETMGMAVEQRKRPQSAAVMVALFVGRLGDLHVLLSQRSQLLTAYPGDTCLIGGRCDSGDSSVEDTARREAEEEIGLPVDEHRVRHVATLSPHLAGNGSGSDSHGIIVWPVVCLITDRSLVPMLNEDEVQRLFSHPLQSFLAHHPDSVLSRLGHLHSTELYHWHFDDTDPVAPQHTLRKHVFETGRQEVKPILGFTARVLIRVAAIAFEQMPRFDVDAPAQLRESDRVEIAQGTLKRKAKL